MAKIRRDDIVASALELLDEAGLDGVTTRRLAQRLGVESSTLYWHVRDKAALLDAMAAAVVAEYHRAPVPADPARWAEWFAENARAFRAALLSRRDGARLHAGSTPDAGEIERATRKIDYLERAGIPREEAIMSLLAAGQFTLGWAIEEQARADAGRRHAGAGTENDVATAVDGIVADGTPAFEFGLRLLIDGIRSRLAPRAGPRSRAAR